jgi:pyruvate formate lyase activating enzyme
MQTGLVFDLRRYSIHDGPGIRTAVFLKGCPLQCAWCHNPEGMSRRRELIFRPKRCILCDDCLEVCPQGAVSRRGEEIRIDRDRCRVSGECAAICPAEALEVVGREMSVEQVLDEAERDRVFYDRSGGGVTFTGGEPLAQPEFLLELLVACRSRGLHTAVDTSGFAPWSVFERLQPHVDLFLYDLKLMDTTRHRQWTGVSNAKILANLRQLSELGRDILVRIPILPGVNDDEENLRPMAEFLASLRHIPPVELLAYHKIAEAKYAGLGREYALPGVRSPSQERMKAIVSYLCEYGLDIRT